MIIFCDGIFDLFHMGHVNHFKKIKDLYPNSKLLVGIMNDIESEKYKRKPIYNQNQRRDFVESCMYVDNTIIDYTYILTEEFIKSKKIDLVIHAYADISDFKKQEKYFKVPIELGIMKVIEYNLGISTTQLINEMNKESLLNHTKLESFWNLKKYRNFSINFNSIYRYIIENLNHNDKILEIGSGSGIFSDMFNKKYNYFGVETSENLCLKNIKFTSSKIISCNPNNLFFKKKFFDCSFSVYYFDFTTSSEFILNTLKQMINVTKNNIYIVNNLQNRKINFMNIIDNDSIKNNFKKVDIYNLGDDIIFSLTL